MKRGKNGYEAQALALKALAHPTRLLLAHRLRSGPACVRDLTLAADCDISTVSLHLGRLFRAGLVRYTKKGNRVYYSLRCPCVLDFLACISRALAGRKVLRP